MTENDVRNDESEERSVESMSLVRKNGNSLDVVFFPWPLRPSSTTIFRRHYRKCVREMRRFQIPLCLSLQAALMAFMRIIALLTVVNESLISLRDDDDDDDVKSTE